MLKELVAALREDSHYGPMRRQDEHAAEAWQVEMEGDPELARAVQEAAISMIATETDPVALDMALILGARGGDAFHTAAALRVLEGPPLASTDGSGSDVQKNLLQRARGVTEPALRARLREAMQPTDRLRMSLDERSPRLVQDLAEAIASDELSASLLGRTAIVAAALGPDCLEAAARVACALPSAARASFLAEAIAAVPERKAILELILQPYSAEPRTEASEG